MKPSDRMLARKRLSLQNKELERRGSEKTRPITLWVRESLLASLHAEVVRRMMRSARSVSMQDVIRDILYEWAARRHASGVMTPSKVSSSNT